jgi:hypothetical protein
LWVPLKAKNRAGIRANLHFPEAKLGFAGALTSKLPLLVVFSVVYGLVFINYIDIASSGANSGYHLWLVLMYFLPFVGFSMLNLRNWDLTVGLGLLASLMNDVFYGGVMYISGLPLDVQWYYSQWLIPQGTKLFSLNLGFTLLPVYSWMMALSIYIRIGVVAALLWHWKHARNVQVQKQTAWVSRCKATGS